MRRLRDAFSSSGFARSWGVMEFRMPSVRRSCFSACPLCIWSAAAANCAGSFFSNEPMSRSEEHTSELQSRENLVCRLLLEKKKKNKAQPPHETQRQHTSDV